MTHTLGNSSTKSWISFGSLSFYSTYTLHIIFDTNKSLNTCFNAKTRQQKEIEQAEVVTILLNTKDCVRHMAASFACGVIGYESMDKSLSSGRLIFFLRLMI